VAALAGCGPAPEPVSDPSEAVTRLQSGAQSALSVGQPEEAVRLLQAATRQRPQDSDLWNDLGLAQEAAGDWQGAMRSYEESIRIQPSNWRPHLNLAVVCMRHGISGRAQTEFEEAVQASPLNADIEWNYAVALVDIGEPERARHHLQRALHHDPQHGEATAQLARVELLLGETPQALRTFARAGSLGVSDANFHANYGLALMQLQDWLPAERQLRLATELDPELAVAWSHLGIVRLQRGRVPEAVQALRRARQLEPDNEDTRYNLASALARSGDHAAVLALLGDPPVRRADLLALQGMSLRGMGRLQEAVASLQQAADKAPRNVDILNNLGVVLAESGDVDAARATWRRVLQIAPANETARSNLRARGGLPQDEE
jgi:tetratricopeptide (TPR) repeat protein